MFMRALRTQARVIYALLMREIITRYGRHNIGFLWLFVEPAIFTLGVMALWSVIKGGHSGEDAIPVAAFAMTGYSMVLLWRNMSLRCVKAIEPNLALMYHRNVKVLDIFIARCLLEFFGATGSFIVISSVLTFLGVMPLPYDFLMVVSAWVLMAFFAVALGLVVGVASERSELFERVWHVCTYLLFPLSGAVFMVEWMPEKMQKIILWVPMVHGTEMIRHGYYGDLIVTHENPFYLFVFSLVMMFFGLTLVRDVSKRVEPS
ncbi:MAG: ABC transporter permease [Micavibrio sp.]